MPPTRHENDTWRNRTHPIKEDMQFQRGTWRAERIGWVALWIIMLLALLGLFSEGPLSTTSLESPAGDLRVSYDRFQRFGSSTEIKLEVEPQQEREVPIRIGPQFLDAFTIESITPRPQAERGSDGGVELVFTVAPGEPLTVYMSIRPHSSGMVASAIGIGENPPAQINQFIYP